MKEKNIITLVCYLLHYFLCIYVVIIFLPYNSIITIIVCISWYLNNNFCLLSQLEIYYFGETFLFLKKVYPIKNWQICVIYILQFIKLLYFII